MNTFDYQQWRTASAVTPEMLDSCLDRIAELEAEALEQTEVAREALKRAEQAEAELKAAKHLNAKWMDERTTALMDKEQAEAHAADCKRLVTACENDLDAERMKRREAEAALAEQNYRAKQLFEQRNGLRELLLNISATHPQLVPNLDEYIRARAEEGSEK